MSLQLHLLRRRRNRINPARYMLASHSICPNYRANTADPATDATQRYHVSQVTFDRPPWSATNVRFAFQNSYTNTFGNTPAEIDNPQSITIRAAVYDFVNAPLVQMTFGGQAEVIIAAGGLVWCDPIPLASLSAGVQLTVRTYSALADGGQRPGRRARDNVNTRVYATSDQSAALNLLTASTFVPSTSPSPNNYAFGPVLQVADNWDGRPVVLIVGDSIAAGNDNSIGMSWVSNAIYSAVGGVMGYANLAIHGTRPSNQTGDSAYGRKAALIDTLATINSGALPMTAILSEHGVNDSGGTVLALQTKMQDWFDYIAGKWSAAKFVQTTYTPRNTNDANNLQTNAAAMDSATLTPLGADRWGVADWIKTNPSPLDDHIDVREAWTSSPTGISWRVIPWSTTLTADANIGATSITVSSAPPEGIVPVLTPGASATVESTGIPIGTVSGSGPYTVSLNKALTKNHTSGAVVKATMSVDALHPEEGYASQYAQAVVESAKVAGTLT